VPPTTRGHDELVLELREHLQAGGHQPPPSRSGRTGSKRKLEEASDDEDQPLSSRVSASKRSQGCVPVTATPSTELHSSAHPSLTSAQPQTMSLSTLARRVGTNACYVSCWLRGVLHGKCRIGKIAYERQVLAVAELDARMLSAT
jgi:hypothetical protein